MNFKRNKYNNNDAIILLKYVLMGLFIILLPITLFLTAFSWYGSLQVHALNSDVARTSLFLKNSLIFGTIGLMSSAIYLGVLFLVKFNLKRAIYKWKKIILVFSIIMITIIFLLFEIFSILFIDYYYSWQLSIVLVFWPLLFVIISVLLLIDYFGYYNQQKLLMLHKNHHLHENQDSSFKDQTGFI